jgi:transmembrane sensor
MNVIKRFFRRSKVPEDTVEAAVYWSARRRLGLLSSCEDQELAAWLNNPANGVAYEEVERVVKSLDAVSVNPDVRIMRAEALVLPPGSGRRYLPGGVVAGLAAAIAVSLILGVGAYITQWPAGRVTDEAQATRTATAPVRYETGVGASRDVLLDDGSVVKLNTASAIEVDFSPHIRSVRLLRGQAFFKVAKNANRPFVVAAGDRRITAVGTAFDVRLGDSRVAVVLVEGRVVIDPLKPTGLARVIPRLDRYRLSPGEKLVASANSEVTITSTDVESATSWRLGQVVFREDTLKEAVAEMNRYSVRQYSVEAPEIANLRVSGVFNTAHPENFYAALVSSYPVEIEQRSLLVSVLVPRK